MKKYLFYLPSAILLIIVAACVDKSSIYTSEKATIQPSIVGSSSPTSKPTVFFTEKPMIQVNTSVFNSKFNLDDWIALRNLSMSEIQKRFSMTEAHIEREVGYGKLSNITRLHNPKAHPGYFCFQDSKLVMLYASDFNYPELRQINVKELQTKLGGKGVILEFSYREDYSFDVYPEKGIAFTHNIDGMKSIEIFQPMTIEEYKAKIYQPPPSFPYDY